VHYETASATRQGDREINQDRSALLTRESGWLLLLADGMGGHPRGELAAQVYIDSMTRALDQAAWPITDPAQFLATAIARAHTDILLAGKHEQPPVSPLTTGVACLVHEGQACWAHVGDSRLYLFRNGHTPVRTRDHSLVQEFIDQGELEEDEREQHPLRNVVTRSLGGEPRAPVVELSEMTGLQPGDTLLLCSDGLWSALPEKRLAELATATDLEQAAIQITLAAELASMPVSDNITLVVLRLVGDRVDPDRAGGRNAPTRA
jgi:serine/threonine protein phosphatase PrpC